MKKLTILAAFGAALAVAGAAQAFDPPQQRGGGMRHSMMQGADANNDGQITKAEADAQRARAFTRMDADNDGFLTEADHEARRAAREAARAERRGDLPERPSLDTNNDGRVSQAEFLARGNPWFDRIDTNNNDVLEASELEAARTAMRARHAERRAARQQQQTQEQ